MLSDYLISNGYYGCFLSLPCVKEHKLLKNCDGKRCATEFVKLKDFSDTHLLNGI